MPHPVTLVVSCRYFRTFEKITACLGRVAAVMQADGPLHDTEMLILARYVQGNDETFRALSMKYLVTVHRLWLPMPRCICRAILAAR